MPRYEDNTRLYIGHLSSRTRSRDLEHIFSRYGRVRDVDMKRDYAFIEFSDPRDADDARYKLDGKDIDGRRITVEFARGVPRGPGGTRDREYGSGAPAPGSGRCFNCGIEGHWARDCKAGDWKNKCYRCGERGHVERSCRNSPKKLVRGRSYSRSPVRSYSPHRGRSRSRSRSVSPSRSYSRSRSPARRVRDDERRVRGDERRSRSPRYRSSRSKRDISPSETRKRSPTPDNGTESEKEGYISNDGGASPKETSQSPIIGKSEPDEKNNKLGYPNSSSDSPENKVGKGRGSESPKPGDDDANEGDYMRSSESP